MKKPLALPYLILKQAKHELEQLLCYSKLNTIYSKPYKAVLELEKDQNLYYLCLFLRPQCVGITLLHRKMNYLSHNEISFFQRNFEKLNQAVLKEINLAHQDRILTLSLIKESELYQVDVQLYPLRPNCYLKDSQGHILDSLHPRLTPSKGTLKPSYELEDEWKPLLELSPQDFFQKLDNILSKHDSLIEFENKKQHLQSMVQKKIQQVRRRIHALQNSLSQCLRFEEMLHLAELIKANLYQIKSGTDSIEVFDWRQQQTIKLSVDSRLSAQELIQKKFEKAKKLKRGITPLQDMMIRSEKEILYLQRIYSEIKKAQTDRELLSCQKQYPQLFTIATSKKNAQQTAKDLTPFRQFYSQTGYRILVGKNAETNHRLTFQYAKGSDLWLHIVGYSGSHVIIKSKGKDQDIDHQTIEEAAQLAIYYSQAKHIHHAQFEVILTERRYVSPTKIKGKVLTAKRKLLRVSLDIDHVKDILQRSSNSDEISHRS